MTGEHGAATCRYILVVPRNAPDTLAYLTESFRGVADVEVVMDRRRHDAEPVPVPLERRADDKERPAPDAFGCTLVRVPRPAA